MITNNLDEALLLSDQIVPMTRGPAVPLSAPISVRLPRPRKESQLLPDPTAVRIRSEVVEFLADFVQRRPRQTRENHAKFEAVVEERL